MFSYDVEKSELMIYDEIGPSWWGLIDAKSVIDALAEMKDSHVTVRLNTPGGSVDEGIAIYNALKRHESGVTVYVDSLAASMGSYLLQAGSRRVVASNAMVMIHDPWTIAFGNAEELRKSADVLDKYAQRMIPDYASRSGKSEEEIVSIMREETWYAGSEIVDAGFADEIEGESMVDAKATGFARLFRNAPAALFERRERAIGQSQAMDKFPKRESVIRAAKRILAGDYK